MKIASVLGALFSVSLQAQLTQTGLTLNFDANQDQDGNGRWESTVSGSLLDLRLDPLVLRSTSPLASGFAGITHAYVLPGNGNTIIAANGFGAEFSTLGSLTSQASTSGSGISTGASASWEIWFRPDSLNTSGVNQVLFEDGGGTGIGLFLNNNILSVRKAGGINVSKTFDLSTLTSGNFIQATTSYNTATNELELHVNGVVVAGGPAVSSSGLWSGGDGAALGTRGQLNMGGIGSGSQNVRNFDGDIATFRMYSGVLSAAQVAANYNAVTASTVFFDRKDINFLWGSDLNWDTNIPPTSAQDVVINSGVSVVLDSAGARAKNLTLGSNATSGISGSVAAGSGTLTVASGDLVVAGATTLGVNGHNGTLILDGGLFDARGSILGDDGGACTLTLGGGTLDLNGNELGTAGSLIDTINYGSGTLQNVGEINGGGVGLVKSVGGTLTLAGTNTYTGGTTISAGTLALGVNNALPSTGAVTINTGGALDLATFTNTVGLFTLSGGTLEGSTGVLSSSSAFAIESGVVNGILGGTGDLTKTTIGIATVNGTSAYTGTTIIDGGTLITGATNALNAATATVVNSGGHLNFFDGTGATTFNIPGLTLNTGSGIGGELGGKITTGVVIAAGTINVDVHASPAIANPAGTTYTLVDATSNLTSGGATFQIGNVYGNTNWTITSANIDTTTDNTQIRVTPQSATAITSAYWKGGFAGGPGVWSISDGSIISNWTTDAAGTANTGLIPGIAADVTFSGAGAGSTAGTVLGIDMTLNTLTVSDPTGLELLADGNTLTLQNGVGSNGILINAGAGPVTIGADLVLNGSLPRLNNNSSNPLRISGSIVSGSFIEQRGSGGVILTGANTFTGDYTVFNGDLQIGAGGTAGSLGSGVNVRLRGGRSVILNRADGLTFGGEFDFDQSGGGGTLTILSGANLFTGIFTLQDTATIDVASGATWTLGTSGTSDNIGMTAGLNYTLTGGGYGTIHQSLASGGAGANIVKSGTGTWEFTNSANNHTGSTVVNGGTLFLNGGDINNTSFLTINDGTVLLGTGNQLADDAPVTLGSATATLDLGTSNTDTIDDLILAGGGRVTGAGTSTLNIRNAGSIELQNGTLVVDISVTGNVALNKTTTGTVTLQGKLGHTGVTNIASGDLILDLAFGNTGLLTGSNVLSLAGGRLILQGDSGATIDSLQTFAGNPTFAANTSSILVIDSNGGQSTTLNLGSDWNPGANAFLVVNYTAANASSFVKTGSAITGSGALTGGILPYLIVKDSSGTGFGTQDGSFNIVRNTNTTELTATNSDATTGTTDFTSTALGPNYTAGVLALTSTVPHAVNTLVIDTTGGGTLDLNGGRMTFTQGALAVTGTGVYTIQNGQLGSDNQTLLVFTDSTGTVTLDAPVSGGLGGFVKQGSGTLVMAGTNTYTGETIVGGGTLQLGSATALDSNTDLVLANVADAIFELNGFNTTVASLSGGGSIGGTIALGSNSLTVGGDSSSTTYAGSITGNGSFVKDGTGTLTLTGSSSYIGSTTVSAGILNLRTGGALGPSGVINVTSGATLQFQDGITVNSGDLNLQTGAAIGQNGGLVNVGGNNSFNGRVNVQGTHSATIAVDSGTLTIDNGNTTNLGLAANTLTLLAASGTTINIGNNSTSDNIGMGNSTLILDGAGNGNMRTKIANGNAAGIVIKNGTGTWNMSQSYVGTNGWSLLPGETAHLRVNAGTIQLGASNAISYGSGKGLVEVNGGTLDFNGFTTNLNGLSNIPGQTAGLVTNNGAVASTLTLGNGNATGVYAGTLQNGTSAINLVKTGTGSQSLIGTNNITGTIAVNGGTLVMSGNSSAISSLSIAGGATFHHVAGVANTLNLANGGVALTLVDTSRFGTELGSTIAVNTGSTVSAAGTITVDVFSIPGSSPTGTFTLASATGGGFVTGGAAYALGSLFNATDFTVSNLTATNTAITIDATAATPLATAYWLGAQVAGSEGVWSISNGTTSNWSSSMDGTGATPLVPGAGTDVILSATGAANQGTMTLGANMSIKTLTISDTTATTLNGGAFSLAIQNSSGSSGITMDSGAGASTLNASVILGGTTPTVSNNSTSNALTLGGSVSGTAGLTKAGDGTVILTAANTYTGGTSITAGTLQVGNGGASGALGSGAITGTGSATLAFNRTGTTTVGDTINVPNLDLIAGTTRLTADTTVTNSFTSAVGAQLETTGNITLDFTSAATATNQGGLRVVSDTLTILPTTINQSPATNASFYYSFDNSGSVFVDDSGANPTQYNGVTSETAGVVLPTHTTAGKVGGAVTFNGTNQGFQAGGAQNSILSDQESLLTYASWIKLDSITNPATIIFEEGGSTNGLTLWTVNGDLRAAIQNDGTNPSTVSALGALTTGWHHVAISYSDSTFRLYLDGALVDSTAFAASLKSHADNSGIGYLQGSTPVTPTNTRFVGAMDEVYYFDDAGLTASQIASLVNGISVSNLGALTLNDGATVNVNGTAANSAATLFGPVTSQGDATLTGSGELIGTNFIIDPGKTLTVNNTIVGRVGLTASGPGTLALTGTNTFDGSVRVKGGTLAVSSDANLGAVPTSADSQRILLDGGTLRTTANLTIAANRGITVGTSNGGIKVDTTTTATLDSVIKGSGTLTKTGAGALLLNSDSSASFTGITQVSAGALQIASGAATGSGDLVVNGATSVVSGTGSVTGSTSVILGSVAPGDSGTANGIGTLTFAGATADITAGATLDFQITHSNGLGALGTNLDGSGNLDWTVIESASRNSGTSDILAITGSMNLVTDATIKFSAADAGTFMKGMAWDLIDWGTLGTSPTSLNFDFDPTLVNELVTAGLSFDTSRFASHGIIAIVPEPGRVSLIGLGLAAALLRRRRSLK